MWQDLVFGIGNIINVIALIPTLSKNKENSECKIQYFTSVMTSIVLFSFVISFFTLKLYVSSIVTFLLFICWSMLALQRFYYSDDYLIIGYLYYKSRFWLALHV